MSLHAWDFRSPMTSYQFRSEYRKRVERAKENWSLIQSLFVSRPPDLLLDLAQDSGLLSSIEAEDIQEFVLGDSPAV